MFAQKSNLNPNCNSEVMTMKVPGWRNGTKFQFPLAFYNSLNLLSNFLSLLFLPLLVGSNFLSYLVCPISYHDYVSWLDKSCIRKLQEISRKLRKPRPFNYLLCTRQINSIIYYLRIFILTYPLSTLKINSLFLSPNF